MIKKFNKKGEVTITQILIASVMFLVFLTAGLSMTWSFFGVDTGGDPYKSNFSANYYDDMDQNRMDQGQASNVNELMETTSGMSDGVFNKEVTVGGSETESNTWSIINLASLKSLGELSKVYSFSRNAITQISGKLQIPPYFFVGLSVIIVIIITIGILSALRGLK